MHVQARPTLSAANLAVRVLAPFAAGYFLSFLFRTVNAVLAPHISRAIHLDAAALGLMTAMYFLAFGAFQLPLGVLLDRYGPRRVEAALLLFAAAGAATFAVADSAGMLVLGRALVGLGVSACMMGAVKANVQWYPPARLPMLNGLILSAGGLGAVAASAPVQAALAFTDWRGIYGGLAVLTLGMSVLLFLVVPDRKDATQAPESLGAQLREIARIFRDPRFLRVMPVGAMAMGAFLAVQGLWAGPWLRDVAGQDAAGVAAGLTAMAAGMTAGFLLMGIIAERLGRLGVPVAVVGGLGMAAFLVVMVVMAAGWDGAPLALCAAFGFFGAASSLTYTVVAGLYPPHMAGRATTSLNLTMFLAAFLLQWGLGAVIGLWPKGEEGGGWPPEAHCVALAIPAALLVAALLWYAAGIRRITSR